MTLTWTAPSDDSGVVAVYVIRRAATAMTSEAELLAGTQVAGGPTPGAAGATQTATVTGLTAETTYHFALRARDASGNWSRVSNDAVATTKARATFQISEVALSNATANGFVSSSSPRRRPVHRTSAAKDASAWAVGPSSFGLGS